VVDFFGLSSSLEENHSSSKAGEDLNKKIVGNNSQITYESSNSNIVWTESLEVVCFCGIIGRYYIIEHKTRNFNFK
jgi:hypothetical protein